MGGGFEEHFIFRVREDLKPMIIELEYELRRGIPGNEYDYEKLRGKDLLSETEDSSVLTPEVRLQNLQRLIKNHTAKAIAARAAATKKE